MSNHLSDRIAALSPERRALLERRLWAKAPAATPDRILPRPGSDEPIPLSFAQQRLWFLEQMEPGNPFYNLSQATRYHGVLEASVLEAALSEIIRRHEALRTTFFTVEGRPVQRVARARPLQLPVVDLQEHPEDWREAEVARLAALEAHRPFNLEEGPLLRASLIRLGPADHVLLLAMHHIVSDGWSMGILARELSALYAALASGRPSPLPELPIQYGDFAVWQRQWLTGDVLQRHLAYWKKQLAGMPPVLELPMDRPRPPVQVFRGAGYTFPVPAPIASGLQAIGRQADATLFMTLLAAFDVLLSRYSRETDVVVGTPLANRTRRETEELIGFFVNPLVLRADLSGDPTFLELVARVRAVTLEAFEHQDLPFEKLVEELQPERNLGFNPLFQVMFVLQNAQSAVEVSTRSAAPQHLGAGTSKFDLTLCAMEATDGGLLIAIEYNTSLFDPPTIAAMGRNYVALLESATTHPERRLSRLSLVDAAERERLIAGCNRTEVEGVRAGCVHELCEEQARLRPDAVAVRFLDQELTFRELNARANRLARVLREQGVGPEVLVGLCLERSLDLVVGLLAILKAGGAYVPLDPADPPERLTYLLEDSGARLLLTQDVLRARLPAYGGMVLAVDTLQEELARREDTDLARLATPDNLAYLLYTSGSTGRPKGVAVPHRGVCNAAEAEQRAFDLKPGARVLQFSTWCFDSSMFELLQALRAGATLCLMPREALLAGQSLVDLLREQRINAATMPPSVLAALPWAPLPDLHTLVAGGEASSLEVVARWSRERRLYNVYGPTEASIWSVYALCPPDLAATPPIGQPIINVKAYVLDEHLAPVPVGIPGELYLGGACVTRGYHRRPGLTAQRFVPDPFSGRPGARMYRTGDVVRRLANDDLQFLGRADELLKVRGYRIEPGEIESVLSSHAAIQLAAVVAQRGGSAEARLVAYLVLCDGAAAPEPGELRAFLRSRLPDYMVPSAFVRMDALPRTSTGKLDRRALPTATRESFSGARAEPVAPRTPTEEVLARLWCEVLELPRVGVMDDFFELGGHSLLANRMASRIHAALDVEPPLRLVFELRTIAALAEAIDRSRAQPARAREPSIQPLRRDAYQATLPAPLPPETEP